jgi:hypothetical protein
MCKVDAVVLGAVHSDGDGDDGYESEAHADGCKLKDHMQVPRIICCYPSNYDGCSTFCKSNLIFVHGNLVMLQKCILDNFAHKTLHSHPSISNSSNNLMSMFRRDSGRFSVPM